MFRSLLKLKQLRMFHIKNGRDRYNNRSSNIRSTYAGSLFTSQNASTWSAEQTDDLKFHLKIAKFTTNVAGNVIFENEHLPANLLRDNSVEVYNNKAFARFYSYSHGNYSTNSNVVISGVAGDKTNGVLTVSVPDTNLHSAVHHKHLM